MLALVAWLSGLAQAQPYRTAIYDTGGASEAGTLSSDSAALRETLGDATHQGYEGPACGCGSTCSGCCQQPCGCGDRCGCDCCNTCCGGTCGCFEPCCHSCGIWASAELLFFRYHRADGAREGVLPNEFNEFDFETTPRLTVGWVRCDGLGARIRYWEFDHCAPVSGPDPLIVNGETGSLCVDTYTLDFEVFDTFCLNRNWNLELAAGIRYNEFLEIMSDNEGFGVIEDRLNSFSGFGVVASAEVRTRIGTSGALFARLRGSILMDDKDVFNESGLQQERLIDVTVGTTELAFGYDYLVPLEDGAYAFLRLQAEWQNWYNYSSSFVDTAANENFAGPSDVGFGGFGVGVGIVR
jgi:hypothetical protein